MLNGVADLLIAQPKLKILQVYRYHAKSLDDEDPDAVWDDEEFARRMYAAMNPGPVGYGPLEFDPSTQSAIRHLAYALQNHPSLHSLTWGNGSERVSQAVALALSAALPHNTTIKELDLSHTARGFQTTLPELLEGAQHVEELLLPLADMDDARVNMFALWVHKTLSVTGIGKRQVKSLLERDSPLSMQYFLIQMALLRNMYVRVAKNTTFLHGDIPLVVWPRMLATLGSNVKEGTPVFWFLKNHVLSLPSLNKQTELEA